MLMERMTRNITPVLLCLLLFILIDKSQACTLQLSNPNATNTINVRSGGDFKLLELLINLPAADEAILNEVAGNDWFRPNRIFLTYSSSSQRLLLLRDYYYGLLRPLLKIPLSEAQIWAKLEPPGCLASLSKERAINLFRNFLFANLQPTSANITLVPTYSDKFNVCTMHIFPYDYTVGLRYTCCRASTDGINFNCYYVENDAAVHALNALLLFLTIFLFLFFPLFTPAAYEVKTFIFSPKKAREVNVVVTDHPKDYADLGCNTIHIKLMRKVNAFYEQLTKMEPDTMYRLKVGAITFSTEMDRLLPEKEEPFSLLRLGFDAFIRCTNWRTGPLRDFCQAPVCGECCCLPTTPWQNFVLSVRTLLVLLVLALPSLPFFYAQVVEDRDYAQIARITYAMGRLPTSNIWFGPLAGKILVGIVSGTYLLHCLMYIGVGCSYSEIVTYTDLLRNSTVDISLKSRLAMLKKMVYRTFVPLRRWGLSILPLWLILLLTTPVLLLLYTVFTSPIIRMFLHILKLCKKSGCTAKASRRSLRECAKNTFAFVFLCTLVGVFLDIAIGFNFMLHVICIIVIDFIINMDEALKIFPVVILFVVYFRDIFKRVGNRFLEFHQTIIKRIIEQDADTVKLVASQNLNVQENTAFVIKSPEIVPPAPANAEGETTPAAAPAPALPPPPPTSPAPGASPDNPPAKPEDLTPFLVRYGSPRARMRSLALFLDKEDIPYIPRKLLYEMTQMTCPGSPGDLTQALAQAIIDLSRIVIFLLLLLVLILAYGDVQFISSGVQFLATVAAGLIPLILRYFFFDQSSALGLETENLRFQMQFSDILNNFRQTWDLKDLTIEEVKKEGCINPVATVKVASKAVTPAPVVAEVITEQPGDKPDESNQLQAVDVATGREVMINAEDVLEAVEVVTAQGVVVDPSRHQRSTATEGVLAKETIDSVSNFNELVTSGTGDRILSRKNTQQTRPKKQSVRLNAMEVTSLNTKEVKFGILGDSTEMTEVNISNGMGINTARTVNRASKSRPPSSTGRAKLISESGDPISRNRPPSSTGRARLMSDRGDPISHPKADNHPKVNGFSAALAYDPSEADGKAGKASKYDPSKEDGFAPVKYDPDKADAFDRVVGADEGQSEKRQTRAGGDADVKVPDLRKKKEAIRKFNQAKRERAKDEVRSRLMQVKGIFKVDGKLMSALKEFSPFGDEPAVSDKDVGTGRTSNSLQIDLVVDISKLTQELPREENRFHYLIRQISTAPPPAAEIV